MQSNRWADSGQCVNLAGITELLFDRSSCCSLQKLSEASSCIGEAPGWEFYVKRFKGLEDSIGGAVWRTRRHSHIVDQIRFRKKPDSRWLRLLPAAAQCTVELDQRKRFALLSIHQVQLSRKQSGVRCQYFQIAGSPPLIPQPGEPSRVIRSCHQLL